ncbi:MAG: leucyl aminopeptidase [Alphaproteobacteria bacterium]|nr:leucyl aminopeptidase [Alphaproteobacteria bacterium]
MKLHFAEPKVPTSGAVFVLAMSERRLLPAATAIDAASGGALTRAVAVARFEGKPSTTLTVLAPSHYEGVSIVVLGIGEPKEFDAAKAEALGSKIWDVANSLRATDATVLIDEVPGGKVGGHELAQALALGARLKSYSFDKYLTKRGEDEKPSLARLTVGVKGSAQVKRGFARNEKLADAIDFTRNLVSEPGNVIYPETLAAACKTLTEFGVKVEVLGVKEMTKLGMGALLGVGQGSAREPYLVVMQWNEGKTGEKPLSFIGKGVTFDTGGISIKPAQNMHDMKWDMGGSAAVIGLMRVLAARKAKVNAVGVVGLVENMPSGAAQRPGDIVRTMSGQTVEVLNTDAEGRLVLADALWYTQDRFKPQFMVDLATLTGAILIALGHEYAGLYASDDVLADRLVSAGKATSEPLWRMPLGEAYDKMLDGGPADVKNISGGRGAGSITAAQFLQRFTNKVPWAHLDIAGMAWADKAKGSLQAGATAYGVRLLDKFVSDNYEN